jgi:hypothetical protein
MQEHRRAISGYAIFIDGGSHFLDFVDSQSRVRCSDACSQKEAMMVASQAHFRAFSPSPSNFNGESTPLYCDKLSRTPIGDG